MTQEKLLNAIYIKLDDKGNYYFDQLKRLEKQRNAEAYQYNLGKSVAMDEAKEIVKSMYSK